MKILYATTNPNKIASANRNLSSFNIEVEGVVVSNIKEIQSDKIEEISINKAKQAYDQVNIPLVVSDSGWNIPALNGFPGPMMAYVNRWFTSKDFLSLMNEKEDRTIVLIECVTYISNYTVKVFRREIEGQFLYSEEGEGSSLDKVITFREDRKSVAKCQDENILSINQLDMWNQLGEYLLKINSR